MNPFLFKAHPLLRDLVEFFANPTVQTLDAFSSAILIIAAVNLFWALALRWVVRRAAGVRIGVLPSFLLAFPGTLVYLPLWLTLLGDVLGHTFRWEDRYIFVFALAVAAQMLGAFYGYVIRAERTERPIGLAAGMTVSLALLLVSIPLGLSILELGAALRIV